MSNIVELPVVTTLDLPPERILSRAAEAGLTEVIVIGFCEDGSEYFASSASDGGTCIWHLERAKLKLLRTADEED